MDPVCCAEVALQDAGSQERKETGPEAWAEKGRISFRFDPLPAPLS